MAKTNKPQAPAAPVKKAEEKSVSKIPQAVIAKVLEAVAIAQPHAEFVYVNAKGEYHLHPRKGFLKVDAESGEVVDISERKVRPMRVSNYQPTATEKPEAENAGEGEDEGGEGSEVIDDGKEF